MAHQILKSYSDRQTFSILNIDLKNNHEEREEDACKEPSKSVFSFEVGVPLDPREKQNCESCKAEHPVVVVAGVRPGIVLS